jgi:hypothetical protein
MSKKAILLFILLSLSCKKQEDNNNIPSIAQTTDETDVNIPQKNSINQQLEEFIIAFNSNDYKKIDQFIDPKMGCLFSFKDGYYPILTFSNTIEENMPWYKDKIYTNIINEKAPDYQGNLQFKKTGFFYWSLKNKFSFDFFDNSYSNHPDSYFKNKEAIKKACNYQACGISKGNKRLFSFYFSIKETSIKLVAIDYEDVSDASYAAPSKNTIAFKTENEVKNYLKEKKIFTDKQNDAYIDFAKKEIKYYDFEDAPFKFSFYDVGEIEDPNSKIKLRKIVFTSSVDPDEKFEITLSDQGILFKAPMGARPPYQYE